MPRVWLLVMSTSVFLYNEEKKKKRTKPAIRLCVSCICSFSSRGEISWRSLFGALRNASRNNIARSHNMPLLIAGKPAVVIPRSGITIKMCTIVLSAIDFGILALRPLMSHTRSDLFLQRSLKQISYILSQKFDILQNNAIFIFFFNILRVTRIK